MAGRRGPLHRVQRFPAVLRYCAVLIHGRRKCKIVLRRLETQTVSRRQKVMQTVCLSKKIKKEKIRL